MSNRDDSYSLVAGRLRPTPRVYVDELVAAGDQLSLHLLTLASRIEEADYYERIDRARHRWCQATLLVETGESPSIVSTLKTQARALADLGLDRESARIWEAVRSIEHDYPGRI